MPLGVGIRRSKDGVKEDMKVIGVWEKSTCRASGEMIGSSENLQ